jgi:hypothetical protein
MEKYTEALTRVFRQNPDKHKANEASRTVLEDMSGDRNFLTEALRQHINKPESLNAKHYPVVGLNIDLNPYYGIVANCWIPLPDQATDVSTKSIHHHGDMLLSTVTAFGTGYEHYTFTNPKIVDEKKERYSMELIENGAHPVNHVAFVDAYVAHLPLYPPDLTITYALWSSRFPTGWKDRVKRLPIVQNNGKKLRDLAVKAGLAKQLELKVVEYFDFYPTPEGFCGIKERREFELGPNEDYLYCLFYILQQTGNEHLGREIEAKLGSGERVENPQLVRRLLADLKKGVKISGKLSSNHYGVHGANFTRDEILQALAAQNKG